jgi:hypothetical protein
MRQSSPALSTTTWHHLPPEIHDRILYFFCLDIITEYKDLGDDPFSDENVTLIHQQPDNSLGGTCLGSLSSALRVSRYFYNSISHVIKFDGETAVKELKYMQFDRVKMITEKFYPEYAHSCSASSLALISYDSDFLGFSRSLSSVPFNCLRCSRSRVSNAERGTGLMGLDEKLDPDVL